MIVALALAAASLVPVHGVVLDTLRDGSAIVRTDPVTATYPARIRRYALQPRASFAAGTNIDALLDPHSFPPALLDPVAAAPFAPGLPDAGKAVPIVLGSTLPAATLVDQDGRAVRLDRAFGAKTLLLSFIFTRCPDRTLCPAISAKFAYLQAHLNPARFALAEITLDPQYDSPAVLRRYGDAYGAKRDGWALLTATGSTIQRLLNAFEISSMRVSTSNFLHDDKLFVVAPTGRVAYVVENADWDPRAVAAEAASISGVASNPFERVKLALVADVIAICGGNQFAGIALLELSLFAVLTGIALAGLWVVARVLWPPLSP
ncbi:MAG: SCO family protein [Candidatus Eremiobacteraeota bacterium]|nr:SCO family protein [Candidatus Eremiobacteraeota bacterium]